MWPIGAAQPSLVVSMAPSAEAGEEVLTVEVEEAQRQRAACPDVLRGGPGPQLADTNRREAPGGP